MGSEVTVIKTDHTGEEVWRYPAEVIARSPSHVTLEARFNRDDMELGYARFRRDDRFVETFYSDRWYSIFEVHDVDDDRLKGWYCNFSRPAHIDDGLVRADDLALDLFVYPDGRSLVLDRDEFDGLPVSDQTRAAVLAALSELQARVAAKEPPFDQVR